MTNNSSTPNKPHRPPQSDAQRPWHDNPVIPRANALNAALCGWASYVCLMMLLVPASLLLPTDSIILVVLLSIGTGISALFWLAAIVLGIRHLLARKNLAKSWAGLAIAIASLSLFGFVYYVVLTLPSTPVA